MKVIQKTSNKKMYSVLFYTEQNLFKINLETFTKMLLIIVIGLSCDENYCNDVLCEPNGGGFCSGTYCMCMRRKRIAHTG